MTFSESMRRQLLRHVSDQRRRFERLIRFSVIRPAGGSRADLQQYLRSCEGLVVETLAQDARLFYLAANKCAYCVPTNDFCEMDYSRKLLKNNGRDDWIRTSDPLTPSQVRYQAAPHPEIQTLGCAERLYLGRAEAPKADFLSPPPKGGSYKDRILPFLLRRRWLLGHFLCRGRRFDVNQIQEALRRRGILG
jgi:hypothetical protein